jgi:hypothetical protein
MKYTYVMDDFTRLEFTDNMKTTEVDDTNKRTRAYTLLCGLI